MFHLYTGLALTDGSLLLVGYFESYEDPPIVVARRDASGAWTVSDFDYLSPVGAGLIDGAPHIATLTGDVFHALTGDLRFDLSSVAGIGPSFNSMSTMGGQTVFLGYNVPPIAAFGQDLTALPRFPAPITPPLPKTTGEPLTLQDLQPSLDWAASVPSYFHMTQLVDGRSVISGDKGRLYVLGPDLTLLSEMTLTGREDYFIDAVHDFGADILLCFGHRQDDSQSEIFTVTLSTGATRTLFSTVGLCTFGPPALFDGTLYVPNSSPTALGGALDAGLVKIEGDTVSEVSEFEEPGMAVLLDEASLWAVFDGSLARLASGTNTWEVIALPDVDLPLADR